MIGNFEPSLDFELRPDMDGQTYHVTPGDPGGGTSEGILYRNAVAWFAQHGLGGLPLAAFRLWTPATPYVSAIYRGWYWNACQCDQLPPGSDLALFNIASGSGPQRAAIILQRALRFGDNATDGAIGPHTIAAAGEADPSELLALLRDGYLDFLMRLSTWRLFKGGWHRRVLAWDQLGSDFIATAQAVPSHDAAQAARPLIKGPAA